MKGLVEWKVVDVFESRRFGGLTTDGNNSTSLQYEVHAYYSVLAPFGIQRIVSVNNIIIVTNQVD